MGIPKPSHRAKVIFAHHTLVMLGRSDLSGRIARQMLDRAEHLQHRVNPLNNRAFELRRIIHSLGLTLERNSPFQAEPAMPVQADIYDRSTEQTRSINIYCQNTRIPAAPAGTPTTQQQPIAITDDESTEPAESAYTTTTDQQPSPNTNEFTSTESAEIADKTTTQQQPIQITVATDGSFNKHTNTARYGFILLTPQLLDDHKHLAAITQDDVLCRKLLAYPPQTIVFRLASMEPGSAQNSFQPEALGAALAQVSLPPECKKEFIMDNTSAMRDITTPSPKPNRSAGRLPQKLHQAAATTFSTTWKARYTDPATTRHQKSHTKATTLEAFLNRCIDVLLTHAPAHLDTAQPDLRSMEHPRGWIIRHKGQHIFGDRRRAILHSFLDKTKTEYTQSETQGITRAIDPVQFDEVHRLAWERGSRAPYITTLALGLLTDTQNTFFTYPSKPTQKCGRCGAHGGATAGHFLQCPHTEPGREHRNKQICAAFRQGAVKSRLSDDQILAALLDVTILPSDHSSSDPVTNIIPLETKSPSGLPKAICMECKKEVTLKASDGKPYAHKCAPPQQAPPASSSPDADNSQPDHPQRKQCTKCGKIRAVRKDGKIRTHACNAILRTALATNTPPAPGASPSARPQRQHAPPNRYEPSPSQPQRQNRNKRKTSADSQSQPTTPVDIDSLIDATQPTSDDSSDSRAAAAVTAHKKQKTSPTQPSSAAQDANTPPTLKRTRSQASQSSSSQSTSALEATQGTPKQARPTKQRRPSSANQTQNSQPHSQNSTSQASQAADIPPTTKRDKRPFTEQDDANDDDDDDDNEADHAEAPSQQPSSSSNDSEAAAAPNPPSRQHQRKQNAQAIATFLGIFNTVAMTLLLTAIPDPRARQSTMKRIRTILLDSAYASWWRHWQHLMAQATKPDAVHLRSRNARKKYKNNKKKRAAAAAAAADPQPQQRPAKHRATDSEPPHRTHTKKRKPPDDDPNSDAPHSTWAPQPA